MVATERRKDCKRSRRQLLKRLARKEFFHTSNRFSDGKCRSLETYCAYSSVAARRRRRSEFRILRKSRENLTLNSVTAVLEHCCAPTRLFWVCKKRACSILYCHFPGPTISREIFAPADAALATSSTPTIVRPSIQDAMHPAAILGRPQPRIRLFRKLNPDIRSSMSSPARFRPASALCATSTPGPTWLRPTLGIPGGITRWMATKCTPRNSVILDRKSDRRFRRATRSRLRSAVTGPT